MYKLEFVIVMIGLSATIGCGERTQIQAGKSETVSRLSIDSFIEVPNDIEGCACYFFKDEEALKKKEYLFTNNYDSIAYVSIDNNPVRLKLTKTTRESNTFGDHDYSETYNNENFTVTINVKYEKANGDESWRVEGNLRITRKDGQSFTTKFVGECGC